jgi:hypothetical protein
MTPAEKKFADELAEIIARLIGFIVRRTAMGFCLWYGTHNGWLTAAGVLAFHYWDLAARKPK